MDIFYFYNGCKNMYSFINKEEDELTIADTLIFKDPLVVLDLQDYNIIHKKLNTIKNNFKKYNAHINIEPPTIYSQCGGKTKEEKRIEKENKKRKKEADKQDKLREKEEKKALKESQKAEKKKEDEKKNEEKQKKKEEKNAKKQMKKEAKMEAEDDVDIEQMEKDADEEDADADFRKTVKQTLKVIIIIIFVITLPLIPFILLSYYSFARLNGLLQSDIVTL